VQIGVDLAGREHVLGGASADGRSTLVFFLSPSCPVCKGLLPALRSIVKREGEWLRVVLTSDGPVAEHEAFVRQQQLEEFCYLLSPTLGLSYQVSKLPYAVLVDGGGVIRAKGLVNSREHLESLFEAKERGVASIQEFFERSSDRTDAA
jgi:methylamine dehydrogenase accessory protein MauD